MNALIVTFFATIALVAAAPSGLGWGLGLGLTGSGTILSASSPGAVISGPIAGGALWGAPALGLGLPAIAPAPLALAAPVGLGAGVITRGGGAIAVGPAGAVVAGPPTAPVSIVGPGNTGTINANGLWGPTLAGVAVPAGHGW